MSTHVANNVIADALLSERYKNSHIKAVMPILNKLSARIETLILRIDPTSRSDINAKIREINTLIDAAFARIQTLSVSEYSALIDAVMDQEEDTLLIFFGENTSDKPDVSISDNKRNNINTLALATLAQGKTFKTHIRDLKASTKATIAADVRRGIADATPITNVAKGVRGTRGRRFKDGSFNRVLNNMDAILRTSISAITNKAKLEYYRAVGVGKYIWISVLDGNTTPVCIRRSTKVYTVGMGPIPPAHHRCRSTISPYKKGMQIPENYESWLRAQPKSEIIDILGQKKGQLFIDNKLTLSKFMLPSGRELTIKELRERRIIKS